MYTCENAVRSANIAPLEENRAAQYIAKLLQANHNIGQRWVEQPKGYFKIIIT